MFAFTRSTVPHSGPTGPREIIPGTALQNKLFFLLVRSHFLPRSGSPLKEISYQVIDPIHAPSLRERADRCGVTIPVTAIEVVRIPLVPPGKYTTIRATRGLLPFFLGG
jgi:hypothetical protein